MQMFHAYFTRAYRYAPQHFRRVSTSGMSTHKQRHSAYSLFGGPFHARPGPLVRTWPPHPHASPLFRAWAASPTYGTDGPHAKQKTHTRSFRGGGLRKIGSWAGLQVRVPTRVRIGNEHADRFNLSAWAQPIRVCTPMQWARKGAVRETAWFVRV